MDSSKPIEAEVEITEKALAAALFDMVDGNHVFDIQDMTGLPLSESSAIYKLAWAAARKHNLLG